MLITILHLTHIVTEKLGEQFTAENQKRLQAGKTSFKASKDKGRKPSGLGSGDDVMNTQMMSLEQIRIAGMEALTRELGIVGMVRFMQQFETGYGDYSKDRHKWLDDQDIDSVVKRIQEKRGSYKKPK